MSRILKLELNDRRKAIVGIVARGYSVVTVVCQMAFWFVPGQTLDIGVK
jgi:hypothetical protein